MSMCIERQNLPFYFNIGFREKCVKKMSKENEENAMKKNLLFLFFRRYAVQIKEVCSIMRAPDPQAE